MSDGSTKASNSKPMFFKNGVITYGTETRVPVADMTTSNGYTMYTEGFDSNTSFPLYMPIPGKVLFLYVKEIFAKMHMIYVNIYIKHYNICFI